MPLNEAKEAKSFQVDGRNGWVVRGKKEDGRG